MYKLQFFYIYDALIFTQCFDAVDLVAGKACDYKKYLSSNNKDLPRDTLSGLGLTYGDHSELVS